LLLGAPIDFNRGLRGFHGRKKRILSELSSEIIGVAMAVLNELKPGMAR
jgi:hypothetical protein